MIATNSSKRSLLTALLSGILFGVGLAVSGMTQPSKVVGFLDFFGDWDASLGLVMGGAVAVHFIGLRWVLRRPTPMLADHFRLPTRTDIDVPLLLGAAVFGVGWGLGGVCPGPAITALPSGAWQMLLFVVTMALGMLLYQQFDVFMRNRRRTRALASPDPSPELS